MKKFKMLVTDIDDTLLNSDHLLSDENLKAIQHLQDNDYVFVLASGRPDGGMRDLVVTTGLDKKDGYIIAYNGGKIIHTITGEALFQAGLSHDSFAEVVAFADEHELSVCSYTENAVVVNRESEQSKIEAELTGLDYIVVKDIVTYFRGRHIPKSIVFGPEETISAIRPKLVEKVGGTVEVFTSKPIFLEVTPKGVHKGSSLQKLAGVLNIDMSEIIAVGDGENDLELITTAGHGIAVENAMDSLKVKADEICVSNDEHAIAYIVNQYFPKK